jgi:hypothetical protein
MLLESQMWWYSTVNKHNEQKIEKNKHQSYV